MCEEPQHTIDTRGCSSVCVCGALKKVFASSRLQDDKTLNYFSTPQKNKTQIQNTYTKFFDPKTKAENFSTNRKGREERGWAEASTAVGEVRS